ncbi:MAG: hypothetical protein KatS3mg031_2272 [Chitinophagales bacterium]|nr:MAG: hypothetical protein KatS3mg031_2272 [Chitinophagales bacterium]
MKRFCVFMLMVLFVACSKDVHFITGNEPPNPNQVPTVLIQNYVNRMFIDLIGREPVDAEMDSAVAFLKKHQLDSTARAAMILKLQTDTAWLEGDTSYKHAYYQRFYDMAKARVLEGESDAEIRQWISQFERTLLIDSLNGDTVPPGNYISSGRAALEIEKLENVLKIKNAYMQGTLQIDEVFQRLCNNYVYDQINMNTFNFIRATFDNLFYRFPTESEFNAAWDMVENNKSVVLFGMNGQNRGDCLRILTSSREFYEGMIRWAYLSLLARFPTTEEVAILLQEFYYDHDFQKVQRKIMLTDEYANF